MLIRITPEVLALDKSLNDMGPKWLLQELQLRAVKRAWFYRG
jgi:hypothetical protein